MKRFLMHAAAIAAAVSTFSATAAVIDAKFTGTVDTQTSTAFAVGSTLSGEFKYDTAAGKYLLFTIGGQSVAPGYASSGTLTPDLFSAIYQAQVSPLSGGTVNSTFNVDLEGISPWSTASAFALLLSPAMLATNLDTTLSTFGFYNANADGTNVHAVTALLKSIGVTAVPEPATTALLFAGAIALTLRRQRHRSR